MPTQEYLIVDRLSTKELTRIFSKIAANPVTHCWEWTSTLDSHGYGLVWYKGRNERVHRLLYAWAIEPVPKGYKRKRPLRVLDHVICENPLCGNPSHLQLVTDRENLLRGKGRAAENARKIHCNRGHLLQPKQSHERQRTCKVCKSEGSKHWRRGPNAETIRQKERERARAYYWKKKLTSSTTPPPYSPTASSPSAR